MAAVYSYEKFDEQYAEDLTINILRTLSKHLGPKEHSLIFMGKPGDGKKFIITEICGVMTDDIKS